MIGKEKTLAQGLLLSFEVGQSTALRPLFVTQHLDQASWTTNEFFVLTQFNEGEVIAMTQQYAVTIKFSPRRHGLFLDAGRRTLGRKV